ncbi:hypothetical protein Tco_0690050 [Tanacetum coccineum]
MRTNSFPLSQSHSQQHQAPPPFVEPFNLEEPFENPPPPLAPMDDQRTMAHLLEAPTAGYEDAIVVLDTMLPTNNGSTEDVPPPVVPIVHHESISKPANAPVSASRPNQKASIPFPSRRNDERRLRKS